MDMDMDDGDLGMDKMTKTKLNDPISLAHLT